MRIGDAVENEQKRRLARLGQHVVDGYVRQCVVDYRNDTLMPSMSGERVKPRRIDRMYRNARSLDPVLQIAHPVIFAAGQHIERVDGAGTLAQAGSNGMKAKKSSRACHAWSSQNFKSESLASP
jgi:hypothetical protein